MAYMDPFPVFLDIKVLHCYLVPFVTIGESNLNAIVVLELSRFIE